LSASSWSLAMSLVRITETVHLVAV